MDTVSQFTSGFTIEPLKEPRGFIKVLQFILSIFAFATTAGHDSSTTFTVKACQANPVTISYGYPYDLESECFKTPICNVTKTGEFCLLAGSQSSAQFYVFVGVIVFLYCLAALVVYLFFDDFYRQNSRIVLADFIASVVIALLWIIGSSAWAAGVSDIKMYTDPDDGDIFNNDKVPECKVKDSCTTNNLGNFAGLNVSLIFGFLNFAVWVGNLWFLYKETPWFQGPEAKPPTQSDSVSETDPQKI
ncbi:synaptophysin [Plakobranchus ocellatus]|uniref:Synaptophysin n=1 Tax=Plakobranchus ocellatus TaxID=259542 RepID=A0AAV4DHH0_9GAST|nr:synaptophysin [Plakobranchus ocellatus]